MSTGTTICPRCTGGHHIPNDSTPGAYPGALSRANPEIEVCSACGTDEGLQQFGGRLTPVDEWPVDVPAELYAINSAELWEQTRDTIARGSGQQPT